MKTPEVLVCPFALLRVAALSYSRATSLAPPETCRRIDRYLDLQAEMEAIRPALEDALFALVPLLSASKRSGVALKLRRDVHNGRGVAIDRAEVRETVDLLPAEARARFDAWRQAQTESAAIVAQAEGVFEREVQTHVRPRLAAALDEPCLSRAIALASPDLQHAIERRAVSPVSGVASTNAERSLLAYLFRASVKTSPFSTFMHVGVVDMAPDGAWAIPDLSRSKAVQGITLNRGMIARLHKAVVARRAPQDEVPLRLNSTIRRVSDGRIEAVTGQDTVGLGRPWRQIRVTRFRFHPSVAEILLRPPVDTRWSELVEAIMSTGLTEVQAHAFVAKLFARDLLWFPPCLDAFVGARPERALRRALEASPSAETEPLVTALGALEAAVDAFGEASGAARGRLVEEMRSTERGALASLGVTRPEPYQNVVLEESWLSGVQGAIGGRLPEIVSEVGTFLTRWLALTPEYVRLRDAFVKSYGAGGRCDDLIGFLTKIGDRLSEVPEFGAQPRATQAVPAKKGATTGLTAQLQIVAASAAAAADGDALVVVNRVYERIGWLAARFAAGDAPGKEILRSRLRDWLVRATAPREPVDLLLNGHYNDLQAHPRLTKRVFAWPGEPLLADREGVLHAHDVVLWHDQNTELLELRDGSGTPLGLVYLGSAIPSATWGGILYALAVLAQPYYFERPAFFPALESSADTNVVFEPRITEGRIVLGRAAWWVRTSHMRNVWFTGKGVRRSLDVATECRKHGIPRVFFARRKVEVTAAQLTPNNPTDAALKPLWIDTRNPFCLDLLDRVARDTSWVALTEALPGVDQQWAEIRGEHYVSEIQVEMRIAAAERVVEEEAVPASVGRAGRES